MKENNEMRLFLLRLILVYRIVCILITLLLIIAWEKEGRFFDAIYPFGYIIYFITGAAVFCFFLDKPSLLLCLILLDFFAVLLYQYFDPCMALIEILWLPGILIASALVVPEPFTVPLTVFMGIPCSLFLSYGYSYSLDIIIGNRSYPYNVISLFFYVPVTLFAIFAGRLGSYTGKLKNKTSSLESTNKQLDKVNRHITERMFNIQNDTTLEERKRISKEIHDTAGYVFINLIMMLQAASAVLVKDTGKAEQLINDARDYAERGINEIRHILRNIREYTPAQISLQNDLFEIGRAFKKVTGVELSLEYGNWPVSFSDTVDSFFKSFMQETLTNALKHGHATTVTIICWMTDTHVVMSVTNNGEEVAVPIKKGIGISAMEDFMSRRNGAITIQSGVWGFKITAALPRSSLLSY